jgi:superfamily II DNA helicase RecQ
LDPVSCRRKQLLGYFNEAYPQADCAACDICLHKLPWSLQDATVDALNALELLYNMRQIGDHPHWTENSLAAAIRGEKNRDFAKLGVMALKGYGCQFAQACGKDATKSEIMEFLLVLIHKGVITEYKMNRFNPHTQHIYIMVRLSDVRYSPL